MVCMYWVYVCDIGMDNAYRLISDLGDNRLVGMCLDGDIFLSATLAAVQPQEVLTSFNTRSKSPVLLKTK